MSCQVVDISREVKSYVGGDLLEEGLLTNMVVLDLRIDVVARHQIGAVDREQTTQWHTNEKRRVLHDAVYTSQQADSHLVHVQHNPKDVPKQWRTGPCWCQHSNNAPV